MAYDRTAYDEVAKGIQKRRIRENRKNLQTAQRAGLSATQVTGDEHWDHFLSIVKAKIEKLEEEVAVAVELLKTSDEFSTEALINQKLAVRLLGREIQALNWVIELPKTIMEQGDKASELLGSIDEPAH